MEDIIEQYKILNSIKLSKFKSKFPYNDITDDMIKIKSDTIDIMVKNIETFVEKKNKDIKSKNKPKKKKNNL